MGLRIDKGLNYLNEVIYQYGEVSVRVLRDSGTALAEVTLVGNHRIELTATINRRGQPSVTGTSVIFRKEGEDISEPMFWSAFGSAYTRATEAEAAQPNLDSLPIEVGDFVEVIDTHHTLRGVVVDALRSQKTGDAVSYLLHNGCTEVVSLAKDTTLVAKNL